MHDLSRHPEKLTNLSITPELMNESQQIWDDLLRMSFNDLQDNFDNTLLSPDVLPVVQQYKDNHETELLFLFLVALPCWIFFKEWPTNLYRKARLGDTNAIHKLLRLDPFLLHDTSIGREIQKVRILGETKVYKSLLAAPLQPIKPKVTSRTIKDFLAGLISLLAEAMKQPLTSTEIRDLFDAIAKDADKRDIDTSLPESQEAYSKVIQRNRPDWHPLLSTGQKKVK